MKSGWLALLILPIILFSKQEERGFFFTIEADEALENLALDDESDWSYPFAEISPEEFDSQALSFLEIDERDDSLDLWSEEKLASEEKTGFGEKKKHQADLDEAFSFDLPSLTEGPALENVPESSGQLVQISGVKP